ncbi:MAG: metallophosphoesterase [Acidobacteria bacterium]|nr:metallophosphoesterase [Acidobacteriota bacterium]
MRIFASSDLHTDFAENRRRLEQISSTAYLQDVLVVAGDIADNLKIIDWTLRKLRSLFGAVFYVPGNHELWVRCGEYNSVEKFRQVLYLCDEIGIYTRPGRAGKNWVVPLFSWYESDYDLQGEADASSLEGWADFYFCQWPVGMETVSEYFLNLNQSRIKEYDGPVITLSHFLPRRELLPAIERLSFKGLPLVAGAPALDRQIRELNAAIHVFGHSHIDFDQVIEGIRYVHYAFDYPRGKGWSKDPLKQIWESTA